MKNMLFAAVAATSLMAFAAPASAAVIVDDLGTLTDGNVLGFGRSVTSGNEYNFAFNLTSNLLVLSQMQASTLQVVKINPLEFSSVPQQISYGLYSGDPLGVNALLTSVGPAFAAVNGSSLGPGNYFLRIGNIAVDGEIVTGGVSGLASAVPEPATWAMMIGGLFGVGALMRRQRRTLAAAAAA